MNHAVVLRPLFNLDCGCQKKGLSCVHNDCHAFYSCNVNNIYLQWEQLTQLDFFEMILKPLIYFAMHTVNHSRIFQTCVIQIEFN